MKSTKSLHKQGHRKRNLSAQQSQKENLKPSKLSLK